MRRLLILLFLFAVSITQAQNDTTDDGWEIVERCVSASITPPDDWSYEGTIIKWGDLGLHGINTDWETPRVLAFLPDNADSNGSKLSPDNRYFAYIDSDLVLSNAGVGGFVEVSGLRIYDTTDNTEPVYEIPIENTYSVHNRDWSVRQLRWFDQQNIVYEIGNEGQQEFDLEYVKIIDVTTGEHSDWAHPVNPLDNGFFYPSPNLEYSAKGSSLLSVFSISTNEILLDYSDLNIERNTAILDVNWSSDSEMAIITSRTEDSYLLVGFYTNDDNNPFTISTPINEYQSVPKLAISPDSRYIAYFYETLHIADLEAHTITNTCIIDDVLSFIWSPDSSQIVYTQRGREQQPINIYDLDTEQLYTIAYHEPDVLVGWRAD